MAASSKDAAPALPIVKSTAFACGSDSGHRCVRSPSSNSSVESRLGTPPAAATRARPLAGVGANTTSSSGPQLAPRVSGETSHKVSGAPPRIGTLLSRSPATNPIHCPSGEKNGPLPPSVPAIGTASSRSIGRRNSCVPRSSRATYTRCRPSGEIASAGRSPTARGADGGSARDRRMGGRAAAPGVGVAGEGAANATFDASSSSTRASPIS